ncbi:MAG: glycoside hydrolase family 2 TIM barrel-domain containing protein [Bacteroidota bacterium]
MAKKIQIFLLLFNLLSFSISAQIKVTALPPLQTDSNFISKISYGRSIELNDGWKVYLNIDDKNFEKVNIPCIWDGAESLYFENEIILSKEEIDNSVIKLFWGGINYSTEVFLNGYNIYKRSIGEIPFEIELPSDILKAGSPNKIVLKIDNSLDSKRTIPLKQRFLFPQKPSGIYRNIYVRILPKTHISKFNLSYVLDQNLSSANAEIKIAVENMYLLDKELTGKDGALLNLKLIPKNFTGSSYSFNFPLTVSIVNKFDHVFRINILNPTLWSINNPNYYKTELSLSVGNEIIDKVEKEISFFRVDVNDRKILFNNNPFVLNGTTFIVNEDEIIKDGYLNKLRRDFTFIKDAGFNAIRFAKAYPIPEAISLCNRLGLIALIELPFNSAPEEFLTDPEFRIRTLNKFNEMIESYTDYSSAIFWGIGSSFLSNSTTTKDFIIHIFKNTSASNIITYCSFVGLQKEPIEGLDLIGVELYSSPPDKLDEALNTISGGSNLGNYFFSEVSYPNYLGISGGYLIKNSTEAQAKYFGQIIDLSRNHRLAGFFINTFFNYTGDFSSLYGGKTNQYQLGIFNNTPTTNNLVYKVIDSKLNNKGKVTIPIGNGKDENKLIFILIALGLSVLMALLINTSRKFRDECSRALFRPYNFYSDIRDHRIISSLHTFILLLIESGSISLFFTILFYYLRKNILIEKLLLSFGDASIIKSFSYLAWNPEKGFLILLFLVILKIVFLSLLIKAISFFIKTKVEFSSIFYMIIWGLLPFTILLPVELILYKILAAGSFNTAVIVFILLFWLWIILRILKGIHVLFEINKPTVYLYGFAAIIILVVSIALYFQLTNSAIYYLNNSIKQYSLISF